MRRRRCLAAVIAAGFIATLPAWAAGSYRSLGITQPENEATIHDNDGRLDVAVALTPPLDVAAGDRLQLTLDGAVAVDGAGASFNLADMPRGAHTIEVAVRDRAGHILLRGAPVTVYMWRASRLFPNRAGH